MLPCGSWASAARLRAQSLILGLARRPRRHRRAHRLHHALEGGAGVADEAEGLPVIAPDLVGIDVDVDDLLLGLGHGERETGPHGQDDVGLQQVIAHRGLRPHGGAQRQLGVLVDGALALRARDHAGLEVLGERGEGLAGVAQHHTAARVDDGPLRGDEQIHRAAHVRGGGGGAHRAHRVQHQRLAFLFHRFRRHLELHRARAAAGELIHGRAHGGGHLGHLEHAAAPLGDGADALELVVDLVQHADVLADLRLRDLTRQHEHRRGAGVRGAEAGGRVEQARPRHHEGGADPAARARVAVRHVRGRLLVPGLDEADVRLLAQRRHYPVELHAGKTEHDADALTMELLDECFAAGHPSHGLSPPTVVGDAGAKPNTGAAASASRRRDGARRRAARPCAARSYPRRPSSTARVCSPMR